MKLKIALVGVVAALAAAAPMKVENDDAMSGGDSGYGGYGYGRDRG